MRSLGRRDLGTQIPERMFMNKSITILLPRALNPESESDLLRQGKRYLLTYHRLDREVQLEYFDTYKEALERYYELVNTPVN